MYDFEIVVHDFGATSRTLSTTIVDQLAQQGIAASNAGNTPHPGPRLILFDKMTDDFLEAVRWLSENGFERLLAINTHHLPMNNEDKWDILHAGGSDVISWKNSKKPACLIATTIKRWREIDDLIASATIQNRLVGKSRPWIVLLREIVEIARFTSVSVMITGETGTGKELVANTIHLLDSRPAKGGLVLLDCSTVVPELSGSEFFGHERGAFTGALTKRDGCISLSHGGTLFLDEIGELPLRLQAELLRVVQEGTYKRVGGNSWRKADFRMICATNRDLREERRLGTFREDFYNRLASWICRLPSLDERREDIPLLVDHFLRQIYPNQKVPELDPTVWDYLITRNYPGNIRELKQVITRLACRQTNRDFITIGSIPETDRSELQISRATLPSQPLDPAVRLALSQGKGLDEIRNTITETAYRIVLQEEGWDTAKSARRLNLSKRAVQIYVKKRRDIEQKGDSGGRENISTMNS